MVTGTDTTLDLHLLQGLGLFVFVGVDLLDGARLVTDLGPEDDVLAESGGIAVRTGGAVGLDSHLWPSLALCHARLFVDALGDGSQALGALYFFAILVDGNGDDRLGPVLVLGSLRGW